MPYPQLTGGVGAPDRSSATRSVLLAVLVLAVGIGAVAWHLLPGAARPSPAPPTTAVAFAAPAAVPDGPTEDQRLHLEHAEQALLTAAEQLTTARRLLAALSPELSRNYLEYEKGRADRAWTSCDAAARAVEQARADIKIITTTRKD